MTTTSSLTSTQEIQQNSDVILALDLVPGILYQTAKTERTKHRCHVYKKHDPLEEQVEIQFYEHAYNRAWMSCLVPLDYPFKKLDGDIHNNISRDLGDGQKKRGLKSGGNISGMGMMECWGLYFRKWIGEPGGREQIVSSMIAEFPDKEERVRKWVDSYKSYYKMGKLPGCVKQDKKIEWVEAKYKARILTPEALEDPLASLTEE